MQFMMIMIMLCCGQELIAAQRALEEERERSTHAKTVAEQQLLFLYFGSTFGAYGVQELLGQGANGIVLRCDMIEEKLAHFGQVALKVTINLGNSTTTHARQRASEYEMLAKLPPHPNIVTQYCKVGPAQCPDEIFRHIPEGIQEYCETRNHRTGVVRRNGVLGVAYEMHQETLQRFLAHNGAGLTSDQVHCMATELLSALRHMEEHGMLHFDLKLDNIMVAANGRLVLIDFGETLEFPAAPDGGFNWTLQVNPLGMPVGNTSTRAPEVMSVVVGPTGALIPLEKQASWAAGMMLYEICMGEAPFPDYGMREKHTFLDATTLQLYPGSIQSLVTYASPEFGQMVQQMLAFNPEERLSLTGAIESLVGRSVGANE